MSMKVFYMWALGQEDDYWRRGDQIAINTNEVRMVKPMSVSREVTHGGGALSMVTLTAGKVLVLEAEPKDFEEKPDWKTNAFALALQAYERRTFIMATETLQACEHLLLLRCEVRRQIETNLGLEVEEKRDR